MTSHHRHQSSLEGVIDFSAQSLGPDERNRAIQIFKQIIDHYEPAQGEQPYKRITLIRVTQEYTLSQNNFLEHFFLYIEKEIRLQELNFSYILSDLVQFDSWDSERKNGLEPHLIAFADYLIDNFFLPLKASSRKTPQPTPAALSEASTKQQLTGTTQRISTLRRDCLIRDRHRCVISRRFDRDEALQRVKRDSEDAEDDDGHLLKDESERSTALEVAHILPHSLTSAGGGSQLSESKKTALAILDMLDPGLKHLIEGPNIDRPINAFTLTQEFHQLVGDFEIYFEPDPSDETQHTYKIDSTRSLRLLRHPMLPVTRTLYLTPDHTIDPPSPRLLAIHRACAFILYLSGAGDYIGKILRDLRDLDEVGINEDGSTALGHLIGLKAGGWLDDVCVC